MQQQASNSAYLLSRNEPKVYNIRSRKQNEQNFRSLHERCIGPSIAFQTQIPLNELKDMVSLNRETPSCGGRLQSADVTRRAARRRHKVRSCRNLAESWPSANAAGEVICRVRLARSVLASRARDAPAVANTAAAQHGPPPARPGRATVGR